MTEAQTTTATEVTEATTEVAATENTSAQRYQPRLLGKPYFRRKKSCPFSGPRAPQIDFRDARLLGRYISPYGKMLPSHVTGVSAKKQRELSNAIKRARHLALMPFTAR
jgi:small subunit ribosomal protein S18